MSDELYNYVGAILERTAHEEGVGDDIKAWWMSAQVGACEAYLVAS
jgi:hypothetical protein